MAEQGQKHECGLSIVVEQGPFLYVGHVLLDAHQCALMRAGRLLITFDGSYSLFVQLTKPRRD